MTQNELREKLLEVKRFAQMGLDSLDNGDLDKLNVRVDQVEAKLKVATQAIAEHKEDLQASKDLRADAKA